MRCVQESQSGLAHSWIQVIEADSVNHEPVVADSIQIFAGEYESYMFQGKYSWMIQRYQLNDTHS